MNDPYKPPKKSFLYYSLIAVLVLMLLNAFVFPSMMSPRLDQFLSMVDSGNVTRVEVTDTAVLFSAKDENGKESYYQTGNMDDPDLVNRLAEHDEITFGKAVPQENSGLMSFLPGGTAGS